jgi:hypothetical protein
MVIIKLKNMIKRINKNIILKLRAKYLKGGVSEKMDLAKEAGSRGFSSLEMEKKLKEMGYDPKRRKAVIGHIVGEKEIKPEDYRLSMKELKDKYNLSATEVKAIEKRKEVRKRVNIALGRESSGEVEKYIGDKGGYGVLLRGEKIKQKVYGIKKGTSSEELGVESGASKAVGHFALSNVKSEKNTPNNAVSITGKGGSVTNQLNNPDKISGGSPISLSKAA